MLAHKRLQKELVALTKEPPQYIRARPLEDDILKFHYVLEGAPGTPYEGGFYHGILKFPSEYPLKPPAVMMYTPNGRFATGQRLCLSMSDCESSRQHKQIPRTLRTNTTAVPFFPGLPTMARLYVISRPNWPNCVRHSYRLFPSYCSYAFALQSTPRAGTLCGRWPRSWWACSPS